jgi:hypothetical protein
LGLTQWFNTDSGFEFNTLFNTFAIVGLFAWARREKKLQMLCCSAVAQPAAVFGTNGPDSATVVAPDA